MTLTVPASVPSLEGRPATVLATSQRGDGRQFVWRVEGPDGPVVLKHYGHKRSPWKTAVRQLGFHLGMGLSSVWPGDRFRTEQELLRRWREAGADVPRILGAGTDRDPWLILEYCPGPTLKEWLSRGDAPLDQRRARVRQLAREVAARHQQALAHRDARLLHTHPSAQHVLVSGPRLVFFDLETRYRPCADVRPLVLRELGELWPSVLRWFPADLDRVVGDFVEAYPAADVLVDLATLPPARPQPPVRSGRYPPVPLSRILELARPHLARAHAR